MSNWMEELDELTKGMKGRKPFAPVDDDDAEDGDGDGYADTDGDGDDDDEYCPPSKMKKGRVTEPGSRDKGPYPAAPNGDDDDEEGGAAVHDPDVLDRNAAQQGGKKQKNKFPTGPKQVTKSVADFADDDLTEAMDASPALESLVKSLDQFGAHLLNQVAKSLKQQRRAIAAELETVAAGQGVIGRAVAKGLTSNQDILKSLAGEVEEIAKQPRPRKGVQKGVERKFAGGEAPKPFNREELMNKSLKALREGRISVMESAKVDAYLNGNAAHGRAPMLPPEDLLTKINNA
jgi:hypothetical protein